MRASFLPEIYLSIYLSGQLCHRRGGGAVRRANAGGTGGGEAGSGSGDVWGIVQENVSPTFKTYGLLGEVLGVPAYPT